MSKKRHQIEETPQETTQWWGPGRWGWRRPWGGWRRPFWGWGIGFWPGFWI